MRKNKEYAMLFIKTDSMPAYVAAAKQKQLAEWLEKEKPFGNRWHIVIVPSDENKVCFFKTESEFLDEFTGNSLEWLSNIKNRLENCLTICLEVENGKSE